MSITRLDNGQHRVTWPVATIRVHGGHARYLTGRPETVAALAHDRPTDLIGVGEASKVGSLEECQRQLD